MGLSSQNIGHNARKLWHAGCRVLAVLSLFVTVIILVMALGLGGLCWRLAQGPLDLGPVLSSSAFRAMAPVLIRDRAVFSLFSALRWQHVELALLPEAGQGGSPIWSKKRRIEIILDGVTLGVHAPVSYGAAGETAFSLGELHYTARLETLLRGNFIPTNMSIADLSASLHHSVSGMIGLNSDFWPVSWQFGQRTGASRPAGHFSFDIFRDMQATDWHHVTLRFFNARSPLPSVPVQLYLDSFALRQHLPNQQKAQGKVFIIPAWQGMVRASLGWGAETIPFEGHLYFERSSVQKQPDFLWTLSAGPVIPAHLAEWARAMGIPAPVLSQFALPVSLKAEGQMAEIRHEDGFSPEILGQIIPNARAEVVLGAGRITPKPGAQAMQIASGGIDLNFSHQARQGGEGVQIFLSMRDLLVKDSAGRLVKMTLAGAAQWDHLLAPQRFDADLHATVPGFDFATLASVWPEGAMKGGRRWMTRNMTFGQGRNLDIRLHLKTASGLENLTVTQLKGDLYGHDLSVSWLRPVQPVTGLEAHAFFVTPDILQIDLGKGRMSDGAGGFIAVPSGVVRINGMLQKDQDGDINLALTGKLPSFLRVLAHPRLHLLSRIKLPLEHPQGDIVGQLHIALPLLTNVTMAQIAIRAKVDYSRLSLDSDWIGPVRDASGDLLVTGDNLLFHSKGFVRHIPVQMTLEDSFRTLPPGHIMRRFRAKALLTRDVLAQLGVSVPPDMLQGRIETNADFVQRGLGGGHRKADLDVVMDLGQTGITTPLWHKKTGIPAWLKAHALWQDGVLSSLDQIQAEGPDLSLAARTRFLNHQIQAVSIAPLRLGRNEMTASLSWPVPGAENLPYQMVVDASQLDITPLLSGERPPKSSPDSQPALPEVILPKGSWQVAVKAQKILYKPGHYLQGLDLSLAWQTQCLADASLFIEKPAPMRLTLRTRPAKAHHLMVQADNLGRFLQIFVKSPRFDGGKMVLEGNFTPLSPGSPGTAGLGLGLAPFRGRLRVDNIALEHPPSVLQAATLFAPLHWGNLHRDRFEDVMMGFDTTLQDGTLSFDNGEVHNAVIGGSFRGKINLPANTLDMQGTLTPFFGLNSAPGKLPHIGWVFAPERGSGLMALTYSVKGDISKPDITVNPFMTLLPGIMRHIVN